MKMSHDSRQLRAILKSRMSKPSVSPSGGSARATAAADAPERVLVLIDDGIVGETINLTLNHGVYVTRGAKTMAVDMKTPIFRRPSF